jgi:hypothetical protein
MLPAADRRLAAGRRQEGFEAVTELIRSNDIVLIGFARALLEEAGVPLFVADEYMSAIEGSIGAFGRRLLVPDDHAPQARRILTDAGLSAELRDAS